MSDLWIPQVEHEAVHGRYAYTEMRNRAMMSCGWLRVKVDGGYVMNWKCVHVGEGREDPLLMRLKSKDVNGYE